MEVLWQSVHQINVKGQTKRQKRYLPAPLPRVGELLLVRHHVSTSALLPQGTSHLSFKEAKHRRPQGPVNG